MIQEQFRDEFPDLEVNMYEKGNLVRLEKVVVPEEKRGQGIGSRFMDELTETADERDLTVALEPSTDFGGSSRDRLMDFYSRFGFVENAGPDKDYGITESMYRDPR